MSRGSRYPRDYADWFGREHRRMLAALTMVTGDPEVAREAPVHALARALDRWHFVRTLRSPTAWTYGVALAAARNRTRRDRTDLAFTLREIGGLNDVGIADALRVDTRTVRGMLDSGSAT